MGFLQEGRLYCANLTSCSVAVRGDVGTDGTAIYETWYAKVVGVDGDRSEDNDSGSETSSDRLNVQVVWFHEAKDALQWLPKKVTHKERAMIKDALHEDVYLLGTAPQYIEQDAILREWYGMGLLAPSDRFADNVIAVDISRLLSTVSGVDDKRILYRWKFNLPPDRAEIVSFCGPSLLLGSAEGLLHRKRRCGVRRIAQETGSGR